MAAPKGRDSLWDCNVVPDCLFVKDQRATGRRNELSRVPARSGLHFQVDTTRYCLVSVQQGARAAGDTYEQPELAVNDPAQHAQSPDEVALASPVRTYQHVKATQGERR